MTRPPFAPSSATLFREEQRFRRPWFWAVLGGAWLLAVGPVAAGMVQQLVGGRPWGSRPMSDAGLIAFGAAVIVLMTGVVVLLAVAVLRTEVREDGLWVRFAPFHRRWHGIPLERVTDVEVRRYRPIRDYGGWGIRYGWKGKAYNVSGSEGVQLRFVDSEPLLIGSQRAGELAAAIDAVRRQGRTT